MERQMSSITSMHMNWHKPLILKSERGPLRHCCSEERLVNNLKQNYNCEDLKIWTFCFKWYLFLADRKKSKYLTFYIKLKVI